MLILFWNIILVQDFNLANNNIFLSKAAFILQPILNIFGIDIAQNLLKLSILTFIIIWSNLCILYFSQMLIFIFLGIIVRYSYKSYQNYIQNGDINWLGFYHILTDDEKVVILKNYLVEKKEVLSDSLLNNLTENILLIQSKQDILIYIQKFLADYKYNLLKNEVFNREVTDQIALQYPIVQKDIIKTDYIAQTYSYLNSIDTSTWIKVTVGVVFITAIICCGIYIYNNNMQISKDMSDIVNEGATQQSIEINNALKTQNFNDKYFQDSLINLENTVIKNVESQINIVNDNIDFMQKNITSSISSLQQESQNNAAGLLKLEQIMADTKLSEKVIRRYSGTIWANE